MILYLVRHGESEANKTDSYHFPDTPLSETGLKQAEILAKRVQSLPISLILSSDLKRAVQTAEVISSKTGKICEYSQNLREFRKPSNLWGKSDDDKESKKLYKFAEKQFPRSRLEIVR